MSVESACTLLVERQALLSRARVLVVGGANIEHGYTIDGELEPDAKYSTPPLPRLAGGSSVNHACRLLAMGVGVDPVLPLAKEDPLSRTIVEALADSEARGGSRFRRQRMQIPGAGLTTPYTTIIRQGASRASLNEFSNELMKQFRAHATRHLQDRGATRRKPDVVMIGHVHADQARSAPDRIGFAGAISEAFLTAPALRQARKFVNFGPAQYRLGSRRWEELLRRHVSAFQLDIGEIQSFCADAGLERLSLEAILDWFRPRCTVVITLERFGAIGQLKGSAEAVAAWPYLLSNVRDSTGAGDAMGAGLVAHLLASGFDDEEESPASRIEKFAGALAFGRVCGAYACTTVGGANDCPTLDDLARFERRERLHLRDGGLTRDVSSHELFLIDRAFER